MAVLRHAASPTRRHQCGVLAVVVCAAALVSLVESVWSRLGSGGCSCSSFGHVGAERHLVEPCYPGACDDGVGRRLGRHGRRSATRRQSSPRRGWRLVRSDAVASGNYLRQAIYLRVASANEPASYTWAFSRCHGAVGGMIDYGGVDTITPVAASAAATTTNALRNQDPVRLGDRRHQQLLAIVGLQGDRTPSLAAGLTTQYISKLGTVAGEKLSLAAADQNRPSVGPTGARARA